MITPGIYYLAASGKRKLNTVQKLRTMTCVAYL